MHNSVNNLIEFLIFFLLLNMTVVCSTLHSLSLSWYLKCNIMMPHKTFSTTFIKCSLVYCIFFELHVYFNNAEWKIYRKPFCIFPSMKLPCYRWRTVLQKCIMLWRLQNHADNRALYTQKKKEEHSTLCSYTPQIFPLSEKNPSLPAFLTPPLLHTQ